MKSWYDRGKDMFMPKPKTDMFTNIEIEINSHCNRRCSYCPNSEYGRGKHFMDFALYQKIINELSSMDFSGIISPHLYGEPLLHPKLSEHVRYAKQKLPNIKFRVFTNGDFLTLNKHHELVDSGVSEFIVTAHDEKTYEKIAALNLDKVILLKIDDHCLMNRGGFVDVKVVTAVCCNYPSEFFVINYKGEVVLCCNDFLCENVMGDLKDELIIEAYHSSKFKNLRTQLNNGEFNIGLCKKCVSKNVVCQRVI